MLNLKLFWPSPALRDCVQSYLVIDTEKLQMADRYALFPVNTSSLTFPGKPGILFFEDDRQHLSEVSRATITGQVTTKWIHEFRRGGRIVTAIFSPVGMHRLFGVYMKDLTDRVVDAADIFGGSEFRNCMESIFEVDSVHHMLQILETFLLNRLKKNGERLNGLDRIIGFIDDSKGNINISLLPGLVNMSSKTFERNFDQKVGICPKLFCRVSRFSHALKMLYQKADVFQVIDLCGYSDQAHFIKEFKSFTGTTPKHFEKKEEALAQLFVDQFVKE